MGGYFVNGIIANCKSYGIRRSTQTDGLVAMARPLGSGLSFKGIIMWNCGSYNNTWAAAIDPDADTTWYKANADTICDPFLRGVGRSVKDNRLDPTPGGNSASVCLKASLVQPTPAGLTTANYIGCVNPNDMNAPFYHGWSSLYRSGILRQAAEINPAPGCTYGLNTYTKLQLVINSPRNNVNTNDPRFKIYIDGVDSTNYLKGKLQQIKYTKDSVTVDLIMVNAAWKLLTADTSVAPYNNGRYLGDHKLKFVLPMFGGQLVTQEWPFRILNFLE
jgi:hypothetical protein